LDELLELNNGLLGVQTLGAALGAVHDAVTPVQTHGIVQKLETLLGVLVPGVDDPPVGLLEDLGSVVILRVPPVTGAGGGAALAEDALVETVEKLPLLRRLGVFFHGVLGLDVFSLQPRLYRLVLRVEVGQIGHKVFEHVSVGEGLNFDLFLVGFYVFEALQTVLPVYVHLATAADTLPAGPPQLEGGVELVLDLQNLVQDHGSALFQVDLEVLHHGF